MNKKTILQIVGIVGVVGGTVALFLTGTSTSTITAVVEAVIVLAGLIAALFATSKIATEKALASMAKTAKTVKKS